MRRAGERSPPAASSPLGSSSACSRGGNHSASSCGERRLETATHLVLALGAGLEARDAPLDAELDPLVIAGLEMQAVVVRVRSPVAAEERLLAPEEDRRGHHRAAVHGELHHERLRHGARRLAEEGTRQVGLVPVTHEGIPVQGVDALEEPLVELAPEARLEAHARLRDAAALAPSLLALLRREGGEVVIEARVAAVAPVKLAVAP